jgi:hypothetical protein
LFANYNANSTLISPTGEGGFESGATFTLNNWQVLNGSFNNWFVGTSAGVQGGTNAAYAGTNFIGTGNASVNHFYRDVMIPPGAININLSFYLKMPVVDANYDYLYVYTSTPANTPVVGTIPGTGYTQLLAYTTPALANYTLQSFTLPSALAGTTVRLVFTYKCDGVTPFAVPAIDNISLTAQLPTLTYSWASDPAGFTSTDQNPTGVVQSATTEYIVTGQNSAGCTTTASTIVTNVSGAAITTQPLAVIICSGQTATFTVVASGPSLTYQWRKDGFNIPVAENASAGTATLSLANVSAADAADYDVVVQASCGSPVTSVAVALTVNPTPTALASASPACLGQTLNLIGSSDIGAVFNWTGPDGFTSADQNPAITNLTSAATGNYTFTATAGSCSASSVVSVTVGQIPTAVVVTPSSASICEGTVQQLTATGGTVTGSGTIGAGSVSNTTTTPYKGFWGGSKSQYLFTAAELTAIGLTSGTPITALTFSISAFTGPYTFLNFNIGMKNTASTLLTALETGVTTVLTPSTFTLTGTAPFTQTHTLTSAFNWDGTSSLLIEVCFVNADGGGASANSASVVSTTTATNLARYYSNDTETTVCSVPGAGTASTTRPNIKFDFGTPTSVTWSPFTYLYTNEEATTEYTGTATPVVYTKPYAGITYTATATSAAGCTNTGTTVISLASSPTITLQPLPSVKCAGETATFTVAASIPGVTYQWRKGGIDILVGDNASAATATLTLTNVTAADAANYDVVVSAACGTPQTSDAVSLTVNPVPTASASSNSPVCTGATLNLFGTTDIGTSYSWTGPNGFTSTAHNPTISSVTAAAAGNYLFTATANGCPSVAGSVSVVVNITPSAVNVTPATASICEGATQPLVATGGAVSATLLSEDFNGSVPGWTTINASTGGTPANAAWGLYLSSPTFQSNDNTNFVMSNSDAQGSGGITATQLITPVISTVGFTSVNLSFWHYFRWWSSADFARVEISTDGGATWNPTALATYTTVVGGPTAFANVNIDLSSYLNQANLKLRFRYDASYGYYWAIDNVTISGNQSTAITWSPISGLYIDALAETAYNGENLSTVYAKPSVSATYTATATSDAGCFITGQSAVTVNPVITPTFDPVPAICAGESLSPLPTTSVNGITGTWEPALNNLVTTTYTFTPEAGQCATETTLTIVVLDVPVVSDVTLLAYVGTEDPLTWLVVPVGGDFNNGFNICIDPLVAYPEYYFLDIDDLTSTAPLKLNTLNGFTIDENNLPANWLTYWAAKGVTAGAGSGTWQAAMWPIINGNAPILYINYTGTDYQLIDGLMYQYASAMLPLRISGDYPEWNYSFNGRVESIDGCWSSFFDVFLEINSLTTPTFAPVPAICAGESLSPLPTTSTNNITGTWSPALNNMATTLYTFTPDAGQCATTTTLTITVNPLPVVEAGTYGPVCIDAADITLVGNPSGGVWTGTGVSGTGPYVFDPSAGTQTLTYTYTDGNTCSTVATTMITVNPLPVVIAGSYGPSCSDGADITLGGTPAGGVWTGIGVSGSGPYVFDPSAGTQTLTYTYTDGNSCVNSASTTISVSLVQTVDPGTYGPVCIDAADILLGGTPAGGIWTGTGVSGGGPYVFDPSVGTQTLTYTYSDGGSCSNSATTQIIVNALPIVSAGTYGPVCIDAADITLIGSPAGGVWTGSGVTGNQFDPSMGTQTLTYTYTDANSCAAFATTSVTVNPLPVVTAGTYGPVCIDAADITLTGSPAGGAWTGTGVTGNQFDPSVGSQTLTYTYTDVNLCVNSAQTTITVNPLPTVIPGTYGPVCTDAADITLIGSPAGGAWTGTGVTGNQFDPSVGTQTLTYTYTDVNLCVNSAQTTITVNPLPTVIPGTYGPVCIDDADITLVGLPSGGAWSGTGVTGNQFDPSVGTQTLTYTYTDGNLCVNSAQTTITVNPLPTVDAGTYGPVCIDAADITLVGLPTGGVWSGTGVSGNQFDPSVGTQTLTYTYTDGNLCVNSAQTTITVNPLPTVIPGTYGPVCIDAADIALIGSPAGGIWTGTGVTGNQFDPSVGTQTLTYTYTDGNFCVNSAQTTIVVNPLPVVTAGTYGPVDINDPDILLAGSPAGGIWTGTGVSGSYVFDPSVGTQTLTYTYTDGNSCSNSDQTTIVVTEAPPVLEVTPANQNVNYIPGNTLFTVTSNKVWVASSNQPWCTVTPEGFGNGTITAAFTSNTTTVTRVANITVTVVGLPPVIVTVTQAGSAFLLTAQNVQQTAPNKLEFDVYILDVNDATPFELASIQLGFLINSNIYTGGTLTASYNNTGSGLLPVQQFSHSASVVQVLAGYPNQTLIRMAGNAPPGTGNGTIISTTGPGTLITRFILTSSVPFSSSTLPNLTFTSNSVTTPLYGTKVAQYISGVNTQLLVTPGNNAIVVENPLLNGPPQLTVTPPSQNVAIPAGSVNYIVTSNAAWTAVSNQPWCIVTPSGYGNGSITATFTENTGAPRTAIISVTVAGLPAVDVTLVQSGKVLYLHVLLEGLYIGGGNMNEAKNEFGNPQFPGYADQITVQLRNAGNYGLVEFSATVLLNTSGTAIVTGFPQSITGDYFITVKHRNSIETTTAIPVSFSGEIIDQDMLAPADVYGGNLQLFIDGVYAIYTGDVNQDGVVDTADMTDVDNNSQYYIDGYLPTDINGDGTTDTDDMTRVDNNSDQYISIMLP